MTTINVLSEKHKQFSVKITDTDSPGCLVSISHSQVKFPNNLLGETGHNSTRSTGVYLLGFLGSHALLLLLGGALAQTNELALF